MHPPVPEELISAYFDGEVTPEERAQVELLLDNSADLRQYLDDTSKLSALLHSFPRETTPTNLATNVRNRIEASPVKHLPPPVPAAPKRSYRREWIASLVGSVITAAACFIAFYVGVNSQLSNNAQMAHRESRSRAENHLTAMDDSVRFSKDAPAAAKQTESLMAKAGIRPPSAAPHEPGEHKEQLAEMQSAVASTESKLHRESEEMPFDAASQFPDGVGGFEPPELSDFLKGLEKGQMVSKRVIGANNAVAVMNLTVLDIEKGADDVRILLQKNDIPPAETEATAARGKNQAKADVRSGRDRELVVFYMRAPGSKLSEMTEMLNQSLNENPKVYKKLEPELPMEIPGNGFTANSIVDQNANSDAVKEVAEADENGELTVSAEANLAVNLFATRNGLRVDDADEAQQFARRSMSSKKDNQNENTDKEFQANLESAKKLPALSNAPGRKPAQDLTRQQLGYLYFHVEVDNSQRPLSPSKSEVSQVPPQQNEPLPLAAQSQGIGNTVNPFNAPYLSNNSNGGFQQRMNTPRMQQLMRNSVSRDPQLVRMMIVLKSEQSAAAPPP